MSITRRNFYRPLNEHGKGEIMDKIGEKVRKKRLKDVFCMLIFIFALVGVHSILAPKFFYDSKMRAIDSPTRKTLVGTKISSKIDFLKVL